MTPALPGIRATVTAAALFLTAASGHAAEIAAGPRAGTTGAGLDLAFRIHDSAHLRLAASSWSHDTTFTVDGLEYDADATLAAGLLLLDWYPTGGGFRVSLGGGWNGTEADVSTPLVGLLNREIPDLPPLTIDLGTAAGTASGDELVPAVLLGWGNPFRGGRWGVSFEIGALYQGEPDVELEARTSFPIEQIPGGSAEVARLLAEEEAALEDELDEYTVLPIVAFAVTWRF